MRRDPLAALARLRRLESDEARRVLGEANARLMAAEARAVAAGAALRLEGQPGREEEYGRWLARGLAERDRAIRAAGFADESATIARQGLVECRAAERALEHLRGARAEAARRQAARRSQSLLDDAAARLALRG
ncbi:hypothetical protein JMJ56_14815 [Belnapia sp. T18]|uniref:Flagellar FliJ protein n=1 Tax=Belnapia arida TaxID=2804533 RepID=A0ABS1U3P1_9PROT|nr:hypothetical protein [Belnapia arida]MBL6079289.1 hypothetical protein [Belnapia arida]